VNYRASRITSVALDVDRVVCEGETFTVFGIMITNPTDMGVEIEFQDGAGNIKFPVVCPACDTLVVPIEFIADKGLTVSGMGSAEVKATIFHSQGG